MQRQVIAKPNARHALRKLNTNTYVFIYFFNHPHVARKCFCRPGLARGRGRHEAVAAHIATSKNVSHPMVAGGGGGGGADAFTRVSVMSKMTVDGAAGPLGRVSPSRRQWLRAPIITLGIHPEDAASTMRLKAVASSARPEAVASSVPFGAAATRLAYTYQWWEQPACPGSGQPVCNTTVSPAAHFKYPVSGLEPSGVASSPQ
jgi:hypothetical protein